MKIKRLAPGLYQQEGTENYIEQDTGDLGWGYVGDWYIRENGLSVHEDIFGPYTTLREAKAALA